MPYAPINPPGARGRVQLEEDTIAVGDWAMHDELRDLLTAGATKDSVGSGAYTTGEWQRCTGEIRRFEARWGAAFRGGAWFRLVLWLAQRDEVAVAARRSRTAPPGAGPKKKAIAG